MNRLSNAQRPGFYTGTNKSLCSLLIINNWGNLIILFYFISLVAHSKFNIYRNDSNHTYMGWILKIQ